MNGETRKYLVPTFILFAIMGVILFLINPIAPLFLVASIAIQLPIIWFIIRNTHQKSYRQRSEERIKEFEENGDAVKWLEQEIKESNGIGRKYWSKAGNALSILNRVEPLLALNRKEEAQALWHELESTQLAIEDKKRYLSLKEKIEEI